jgi:hypothetical protein
VDAHDWLEVTEDRPDPLLADEPLDPLLEVLPPALLEEVLPPVRAEVPAERATTAVRVRPIAGS